MPSYFITHPEVVVEPEVPIERWRLSAPGRLRALRISDCAWDDGVEQIVSSTERKAIDAAATLACAVGMNYETAADLGEDDRSSTGFLPPIEFEAVADEFFARPSVGVRGWETAANAQSRIVAAVRRYATDRAKNTAFVAHGAVGTLLYCDLIGEPISRKFDQPGQGSYFAFDPVQWTAHHAWLRIE